MRNVLEVVEGAVIKIFEVVEAGWKDVRTLRMMDDRQLLRCGKRNWMGQRRGVILWTGTGTNEEEF